MAQVTFTPTQQQVVDAFKADPYLHKTFYFTGGTALSVFYLHHRDSDDLDFFTDKEFSSQHVLAFMGGLKERFECTMTLRQPEGVQIMIFMLTFPNGEVLKVDFNRYPFRRIEPGKTIEGLDVDSLRDIATNKLLTINQRTEVKDFVDMYFLLREYTLWDLLYGVETKFKVKLDTLLVASDFLKVEEFDFLPRMILPLDIPTLQAFFRAKAVELGKRVTSA